MQDPTTALRSEESTSERSEATNSHPSNDEVPPSGADEPSSSAWGTGRTHPTVISGRVSHAVKDRAKEIANARGISLCAFVRTAIHSALRDHADAS